MKQNERVNRRRVWRLSVFDISRNLVKYRYVVDWNNVIGRWCKYKTRRVRRMLVHRTVIQRSSLKNFCHRKKDQRSYFAKRPLKVIDDPSVTDLVFPFVFLKKTSNGKKKKSRMKKWRRGWTKREEREPAWFDHETRGKEESRVKRERERVVSRHGEMGWSHTVRQKESIGGC